jgi:hypothetical protein
LFTILQPKERGEGGGKEVQSGGCADLCKGSVVSDRRKQENRNSKLNFQETVVIFNKSINLALNPLMSRPEDDFNNVFLLLLRQRHKKSKRERAYTDFNLKRLILNKTSGKISN